METFSAVQNTSDGMVLAFNGNPVCRSCVDHLCEHHADLRNHGRHHGHDFGFCVHCADHALDHVGLIYDHHDYPCGHDHHYDCHRNCIVRWQP